MFRRALLATLLVFVAFERDANAFCRATACKCPDGNAEAARSGPGGMPLTTCDLPDGACPRDEHGCRTTGAPIAWPGRCVGYSANLFGTGQLSEEEWTAAFDEAFSAWQLADCGDGKHPSIELFALRPTFCQNSQYSADGPNVNTVYFTDNGWPDKNKASAMHTIARTKTNYSPAGIMLDADIAINSTFHEFNVKATPRPAEQDLVSVLTHEVGHFLGIDHSDVNESVMFWQAKAGTKRRALTPDDVAAICEAYPPSREATCNPTPRGGLRDTCGPDPSVKVGCTLSPKGDDSFLAAGALFLGISLVRSRLQRRKRS